MNRTQAAAIQADLNARRTVYDDTDSYDTRYEVSAIWNEQANTGEVWVFSSTRYEDRFKEQLAFVRSRLTGTGTRLLVRVVPGWDDGDECTVLENVVL